MRLSSDASRFHQSAKISIKLYLSFRREARRPNSHFISDADNTFNTFDTQAIKRLRTLIAIALPVQEARMSSIPTQHQSLAD